MRGYLALAIALAVAVGAEFPCSAIAREPSAVSSKLNSSKFDGVWKVAWPCSKEPRARRKFCKSRVQNMFELDLWSADRKICGTFMSVADFGDKVDEDEDWGPSVVGAITSNKIIVKFRSHWGATGHAELRIEGGELYWRILDASSADYYLPYNAALRQTSKTAAQSTPKGLAPPPLCSGVLAGGG